jgi:hypothetical protein
MVQGVVKGAMIRLRLRSRNARVRRFYEYTPLGLSDYMTIHRLIQNLAFNQDDIERLAAAYEEALRALHISDRDDPINKVIAQRIIEAARAGVRDPIALCKMAVKDLIVP